MRFRTVFIVLPALFGITAGGALVFDRSEQAPIERKAVVPSAEAVSAEGGGRALTEVEMEGDDELLRLVELEVTTPEVVRAVVALTKAAGEGDRSALIELSLKARDPLVCGNAVRALGRIGAFSSNEELLALTTDRRIRVRQDAVVACGLDGGVASVPFLGRVLEGSDATLRPLAIEALGRIGGEQAETLLRTVLLGEPSKTERVFARVALERMRS